jgi:chromo domain-containing protein 1
MSIPSEPAMSHIGTASINPPPISATADTDVEDDDISLTSTAASEFQDEYEVDTIHAQEFVDGEKQYLVKWKGYSDLRCTWEPVDSFNTGETLDEWRRKKRAIQKGTRAPFDIAKWEAECKAAEDASQDRKRRRKEKRARLALSASGQKNGPAALVKDPARPTQPRNLPPSDGNTSLAVVKGKAPVRPKSPNESRTIQPTINRPKTRVPEPTTAQIQNRPARRIDIPKAAPPNPVAFTVRGGRTERKDLASVLQRARQHDKTPAEQNKTWKLFSTTHKFDKASRQDPEPNRDDLELQSPKTWSPFQMSASLRRRKSMEDNSLFVEQDEPSEIQESILPYSPVITTSSPILQSRQSNITDVVAPTVSSVHDDQEARRSSLTDDTFFTSEPAIPTGFRGRKSSRKGFFVGPREMTKKTDLLCKLSYGPDAIGIGDTLLCDLSGFARNSVYALKHKDEIRIRFELCTLEHYQALSDEVK